MTIGFGFTMASAVFADYWRKRQGHDLRMGDQMTREDGLAMLKRLLNGEYAEPVRQKFGRLPMLSQHQFDAAVSIVYNCGPGTLGDRWAKAFANGDPALAASLMRTTRTTAKGKKLTGLVRRRNDEANLLLRADYAGVVPLGLPQSPNVAPAVSNEGDEVLAYQRQLVKLGYNIEADGVAGPRTRSAVLSFQRDNGLVADGIVGPATRATLTRMVAAQKAMPAVAVGAPGIAAISAVGAQVLASGTDNVSIGYVIGAAAVVGLIGGVWLWRRYGGEVKRMFVGGA